MREREGENAIENESEVRPASTPCSLLALCCVSAACALTSDQGHFEAHVSAREREREAREEQGAAKRA